jgi:hypothetical protein
MLKHYLSDHNIYQLSYESGERFTDSVFTDELHEFDYDETFEYTPLNISTGMIEQIDNPDAGINHEDLSVCIKGLEELIETNITAKLVQSLLFVYRDLRDNWRMDYYNESLVQIRLIIYFLCSNTSTKTSLKSIMG